MKKNYIQPLVDVIEKAVTNLLAASDPPTVNFTMSDDDPDVDLNEAE